MWPSNPKLAVCLLLAFLYGGCAASPRSYTGKARMDTLALHAGESLQADAQECSLRLTGSFARLRLRGKDNFVKLQGRVERLEIEGEQNQVECAEMPGQIWLHGKGQRVKIVERAGTVRPEVHVEGTDQAVTYRQP